MKNTNLSVPKYLFISFLFLSIASQTIWAHGDEKHNEPSGSFGDSGSSFSSTSSSTSSLISSSGTKSENSSSVLPSTPVENHIVGQAIKRDFNDPEFQEEQRRINALSKSFKNRNGRSAILGQ